MNFKPDSYQLAIHNAFINSESHLFIDAKAGTGKTTTLVYLMEDIPDGATAISLAFNKKIQQELQERIPETVACQTLSSYGFAALRENGICNSERWKVGKIITKLFPKKSKFFRETLRDLVGFHKNTLEKNSQKLVDTYNINLYGLNSAELFTAVPRILKKDISMALKDKIWDFDDQLWLPIKLDLELPTFDYIFIDETQDLNKAQIELVFKAIGTNGRVIAVGDPFQSVYAFRGADEHSIKDIVSRLEQTKRRCQHFPLSISYRCSKKVIEEAQLLVPEIKVSPNAVEGSVGYRQKDELITFFKKLEPKHLQANNGMRKCMILCRSNSPLIEWYLFIKDLGLPVSFQSSLVCNALQQLVATHSRYHTKTVSETCHALYIYGYKVSSTMLNVMAREHFLDKILTLIEIIKSIPQETKNLDVHYKKIDKEIEQRFTTNTDPDIDSILISTVHRAKGLEASRVLIIRPDLMPHPLAKSKFEMRQEKNIKYVAITRSSKALYYIVGKEQEATSLRAFFEN